MNAGFVWNENRLIPKYFTAACSRAQLFRLRFYVLYGVIISEWFVWVVVDYETARRKTVGCCE